MRPGVAKRPKIAVRALLRKATPHLVIVPACLLAALPYALIALSAFNTSVSIKRGDILSFSLSNWSINFRSLLSDGSFLASLVNSFIVSVLTVILGVALASLAGYAYVMYKNRLTEGLFTASFLTIMIPASVLIIPLFMMLRSYRMLDSLFSVVLVSLSLPFLTYLFRQNTKLFPPEIIKAGRIDGLSELSIFLQIYLPNMKAVFVTASLILFIDTWNSLLYPLVIIQSQKKVTLPVYVNSIGSSYTTDYGAFMMALSLSTFPILLIFVLAQKKFREGMKTLGD